MSKKLIFIILIAVMVLVVVIIASRPKNASAPTPAPTKNATPETMEAPLVLNSLHTITITTNLGEIQFETYDTDAPNTVNNFISLANKDFYNNLIFHRVINKFMIQGGDPNCIPSRSSGPCGAGGPGYQFEDELNPSTESYKAGYRKGVVAMANSGPNTNGSQFFIVLENTPLPNNYTIFGNVIKGQEVVDAIGNVPTDQGDHPLTPVTIKKVIVEKK